MPGETRIALLPLEIKQAVSNKLSFQIETGAGQGAYFSDESYKESGADIVQNVYSNSHFVFLDFELSLIHAPFRHD